MRESLVMRCLCFDLGGKSFGFRRGVLFLVCERVRDEEV
jgi:hypothetical protein